MRRAFTVLLLSLSLVTAGAACSKSSKSSGKNSAYCDLSKKADETASQDPATPAEELEQIEALQEIVDDASGIVPSEIEADFKIWADAYGKFSKAFKESGGDFTKIDRAILLALKSPEFEAAEKRMEKYDEEKCGIKPDTTDVADPSS